MSGEKTIETRGYPLPEKYKGVTLAVIETPGPRGLKEAGITKAKIIGTITFSRSKEYRTQREWALDANKHRVETDDPLFGFKEGKRKFGWMVESVSLIEPTIAAPSTKGIVFASRCEVPITSSQPLNG
jgi:hypothetical protein